MSAKGGSRRDEEWGCYTIRPRNRLRRLRFLVQFLNDETMRERSSNPRLFDGPSAAFDFPSISVRDFAALRLAEALGLPWGRPDKSVAAAIETRLQEIQEEERHRRKLCRSDRGREQPACSGE